MMFLGLEACLIPSYTVQAWLYFERIMSFLLCSNHCYLRFSTSVTGLLRNAPLSAEMRVVPFYLISQQFLSLFGFDILNLNS